MMISRILYGNDEWQTHQILFQDAYNLSDPHRYHGVVPKDPRGQHRCRLEEESSFIVTIQEDEEASACASLIDNLHIRPQAICLRS
mmetsp:Transcript_22879/g.56426  ORF Transcript_22879/g.56426 Transcript_22879/m.56426 type:complete len:86 (+) Transcript_22879:178-435(+)